MLVLITDSVRFPDIPARLAAIARAVPPGSIEVQVREKHMDGGPLLAYVRAVMAAAPGVPVWVNDRVDVALAAGAYGVHLPERGMSIADARELATRLKVGVSVHASPGTGMSAHAQTAAAGADSIHLGPIWETPGKGPPLGPGVLAFARMARLIAVGGIDSAARAREAIAAGANGVAVIRAAWSSDLAALTALVAAAAR